ncbi:MAG: cytochrome P450 [Acidobacteriota bacterium]|nr:cytochrome P450 [Acidobacteriota bacterium]
MFAPEVVADPHPLLARLRRDDPVHWSERHRAWLLTRYDDVLAGFKDPRMSAERVTPARAHPDDDGDGPVDPVAEVLANWMVFKDPPDHPRLRRLVSTAFRPRAIARLEPVIEATVEGLLDDLGAHARSGQAVDLTSTFAGPLPAIVIAHMLGVPEGDQEQFRHWSDELTDLVFGATEVADRRERGQKALRALADYCRGLIESARRHPADNVLGSLVQAHDEGDRLSTEELISTCTLLLFGGHETTRTLIANGVAAALAASWDLAEVMTGPGAATAVEEMLRFEGPAKVEVRHAAAPVEWRGRRIEAGQRVFLAVIAANRDPEQFESPDVLDLRRDPNPHLGFGFGAHFCLGATLARVETRIALRGLLRRYPEISLAQPYGSLPWRPALISRSLLELPVILGSPGPDRHRAVGPQAGGADRWT